MSTDVSFILQQAMTILPRVDQYHCAHSKVEREQNTTEYLLCNRCGRKPSLGILYQCVDDCRHPLEDSYNHRCPLTQTGSSFCEPRPCTESKSVDQSHYSPEQIYILCHQKLKVKQLADEHFQHQRILRSFSAIHLGSNLGFIESTAPFQDSFDVPRCRARFCHGCLPAGTTRTNSLNEIVAICQDEEKTSNEMLASTLRTMAQVVKQNRDDSSFSSWPSTTSVSTTTSQCSLDEDHAEFSVDDEHTTRLPL